MLTYRGDLKPLAGNLRSTMTDAEQKLWFHLRRKQILDVQFYRQRPIGKFIVDFYAPSIKLVVEADGAQHFDEVEKTADTKRTAILEADGLMILRFDNLQILTQTESVLDMIHTEIVQRKSLPHLQREELA